MKTLREAIDAASQGWGARPFLIAAEGDHILAYGALGDRVRSVAVHLRAMGALPGRSGSAPASTCSGSWRCSSGRSAVRCRRACGDPI